MLLKVLQLGGFFPRDAAIGKSAGYGPRIRFLNLFYISSNDFTQHHTNLIRTALIIELNELIPCPGARSRPGSCRMLMVEIASVANAHTTPTNLTPFLLSAPSHRITLMRRL